MRNNAVEALLKERDKLVIARDEAAARFNDEIMGLETAIEKLSGKKVWEAAKEIAYDDEHPDYIKASIED
jgi:hypothetical protein